MINQIRLELLARGSFLRTRRRYAGSGSLSPARGIPLTPVDSFGSCKIASRSNDQSASLRIARGILCTQRRYAGGGSLSPV
jgi:hypothetical protein